MSASRLEVRVDSASTENNPALWGDVKINFDWRCANVVFCASSTPPPAANESLHMSSKSKIYGTVFFARQESGIVSHLSVPVHPPIDALERAMRVDFDAEAAAGGSSVRLQFTETLDNALVDPCGGPDLDVVIAASALGLLRLYGRESLSVVDQGNQYKYVPVEDGEHALRSLQVFGRPVARPVTSSRLY